MGEETTLLKVVCRAENMCVVEEQEAKIIPLHVGVGGIGYGIGKGVQAAANKMMRGKMLADNYIVTNKGNVVKQPGVPDDPSTINIFRGTETYSDAILDAGYVATLTKGEMALIRFAENATQTLGVMFGAGAGVMGYTMEPGANPANNWGQVRLRDREYGMMNNDGKKFPNDYKLTVNGSGTRYLVHGGTTRANTRGCILLGEGLNSGNLVPGKVLGVFRNYLRSAGPSNIRLKIYGN